MQLYFIRHAESKNNLLYATTGSWRERTEDPWVTPRGEQQAQVLAHYIKSSGIGLTHIYSSLMVRAAYTASQTALACNLPVLGWPDLHENGGVYNYDPQYIHSQLADNQIPRLGMPGRSHSHLKELFPNLQVPPEVGEEGWWNKPYEELPARAERASRVLAKILAVHGGTLDRVALVSHGAFYSTFLRTFFQMPASLKLWFHLNNCAISLLDFGEGDAGDQDTPLGETRVIYLNRTDFLPADLIS